MNQLIRIFVIVLVLALVIWAIGMLPFGYPWIWILRILAIVIAVVALLRESGVIKGGTA